MSEITDPGLLQLMKISQEKDEKIQSLQSRLAIAVEALKKASITFGVEGMMICKEALSHMEKL